MLFTSFFDLAYDVLKLKVERVPPGRYRQSTHSNPPGWHDVEVCS